MLITYGCIKRKVLNQILKAPGNTRHRFTGNSEKNDYYIAISFKENFKKNETLHNYCCNHFPDDLVTTSPQAVI